MADLLGNGLEVANFTRTVRKFTNEGAPGRERTRSGMIRLIFELLEQEMHYEVLDIRKYLAENHEPDKKSRDRKTVPSQPIQIFLGS